MLNACKIHKGIKKIQSGVRQIFYWTLEDDNKDMYYWELTDLEQQQDEIKVLHLRLPSHHPSPSHPPRRTV